MTTTLDNIEFKINHVNQLTSGYGHKRITVELSYKGNTKGFTATTDNMPGFDNAMDLEDYEEKQMALFGLVESRLEDTILDWAFNIDNQ